jgi:hypothetical protein
MTSQEVQELKTKIVIDTIDYWREKKPEQKEAVLKLIDTYRRFYRVSEYSRPKIEPFEALKTFLSNKPMNERINILISSL